MSVLRSFLKASFLRRIKKQGRADLFILGLKHIAPNWKSAEFLIKDIYIGLPYMFGNKKMSTIFDVGANCGFATLFFKSLYPASQIFAIEPQKRESTFLCEAISKNNIQNVQVLTAAVGDFEGNMELSVCSESTVLSSFTAERSGFENSETTQVVRLSRILPLTQIDLLKLDVEGAEGAVLRDLSKSECLTPKRIKNIIMEYHHFDFLNSERLPEILELLVNHGYKYSLDARKNIFSHNQDILIYCEPMT